MTINGVNRDPITPIPQNRAPEDGARQRSASTAGVSSGQAQFAAQQIGWEGRPPRQAATGGRTGVQPLNASGRGQIVNVII